MSDNDVLKEADWLEPSAVPDLCALIPVILLREGRCVVCGAEQPHDVRWPAFAFEVQRKDTGQRHEHEFRTCHQHEAEMDATLARLCGL